MATAAAPAPQPASTIGQLQAVAKKDRADRTPDEQTALEAEAKRVAAKPAASRMPDELIVYAMVMREYVAYITAISMKRVDQRTADEQKELELRVTEIARKREKDRSSDEQGILTRWTNERQRLAEREREAAERDREEQAEAFRAAFEMPLGIDPNATKEAQAAHRERRLGALLLIVRAGYERLDELEDETGRVRRRANALIVLFVLVLITNLIIGIVIGNMAARLVDVVDGAEVVTLGQAIDKMTKVVDGPATPSTSPSAPATSQVFDSGSNPVPSPADVPPFLDGFKPAPGQDCPENMSAALDASGRKRCYFAAPR